MISPVLLELQNYSNPPLLKGNFNKKQKEIQHGQQEERQPEVAHL